MMDTDEAPLDSNVIQPATEQGFFDKSWVIRLLVGLLFFIALFFSLHFRESPVEVLELGVPASHYIVAERGFAFRDEEVTLAAKLEATEGIEKIWRISEGDLIKTEGIFEDDVAEGEWKKELPESSEEDLMEGGRLFIVALSKVRLTDEGTLKKIKELGKSTPLTFAIPEEGGTDFLTEEMWKRVKQRAFFKEKLPKEVRNWIATFFQNKKWNLEEATALTAELQEEAQNAVAPLTTQVSPGTRIIEEGELATARHVAMVSALNRAACKAKGTWKVIPWIGSFLLSALFFIGAAAYLRIYHRDIFRSNKKLFLITIIGILTLLLAKGTEFLLVKGTLDLIHTVRFPLFVPFAAVLVCSLLNARIGAFMVGFLSIILSLVLLVDATGFLVINVLTGITVILSTRSLRRRKEIFAVCGKAYIGCILIVISFHLYENAFFELSTIWDLLSTFIFMLATAVLVVGLLPLFEACFRMVTEITLMEYMDPIHPLLRRLSVEAPGTYQHSIVVGNLAEAAAIAIGANGLFCRAATLYHDIGKLAAPQYFTENQQGGMNIHSLLTPQESAQVIMNHVPEGVAIARKHSLPEAFIQIIKEHHGDTLVYYFYHKQVDMMGGDAALVDEEDFRYSGPKPRTKESGIIMIADTVEAASRSIKEMTEETVGHLVRRLVQEKVDDGQFERSLLTYEDLEIVKKYLIRSVLAAAHTRIKYPTRTPPAGGADDPAWPPLEEPPMGEPPPGEPPPGEPPPGEPPEEGPLESPPQP